jgi:hypothetical protein
MKLLVACLALASPAGPQDGPAAGAPRTPAERHALAGLAGFRIVSRLDFGAEQNRLTAVYLFPDRVRWHFEAYGAKRSEHLYLYRLGERVHELRSGGASRELVEAERDGVLLQMELRRALFFWPDGFEWLEREPGSRRALVRPCACCRKEPIGELLATLDDAGRPREIRALAPDGRVREGLTLRAWQELAGRGWPKELALFQGGTQQFEETVESVETRVHFSDPAFLPPDRRLPADTGRGGLDVLSIDLIAVTHRERELPAGSDWPEALDRARAWIEEARAELVPRGLAVDPVPTFLLGPDARPRLCLVRLAHSEPAPPPGWETIEERPGLALRLEEISELTGARLAWLRALAPADAHPGEPYLRLQPDGPGRVQVVLPLEGP